MTAITRDIVSIIDMMPENEQRFACEVIKKLFLAWDADFTKLTPAEAIELETARQQIQNGEYYDDNEIDWDNLDKLNLD
ncbi:MAG: hypothetical protein FWH10_06405 [Oscillospiraceae bacterium]|nr:hypothetical protein [Oscillospiraceae bacterium]